MRNKILLGLLLFFIPFTHIWAEDSDKNTYKTAERLFYIERSVNKNLVCYDANIENGILNTKSPINVYWLNREDKPGKTNGLNYIQRKLAYGYKLVSSKDNTCVCTLTAYPKRELSIVKRNSKYICLIKINNQEAILQSLYVKADPQNSLKVEYVELRGLSIATNQMITEKIKK